ncbi:MAG: helix-turn-helix domain-containing protein [Bacteroidales bacterium]|jgi:transcriptional regulator GlxA family with amidase domain|nr:helix-turn-helix domain-containing protein [Bacteroidales bacterium]
MKKVGILVLEDCTPMTMIGSMEVLNKAGRYYYELNGVSENESFFDVRLISWNSKMVNTANNYPIYCHNTVEDVGQLDLIIITGLDGDLEYQLKLNYHFVDWIKHEFNKGTEIASVCSGAFILAETGLLDGRSATTHWAAVEYFKMKYPQITVLPQEIIVDEGNLYTSGGATSYHNLMIYLVEKFCGKETAIYTSKMLLIDINKEPQSSYAIFSTQKLHSDKEILFAQKYIESNINKHISLDEISDEVAISKRNFIRRFKNATGNTPIEYIQRVRVEAVKKALETTQNTIGEIVNNVGYEDMTTFRKLFKRITGISPNDYRKKYTRLTYSLN